MPTKKIEDALNEQLNKELYSGYLYLGMSAYAAATGLPGFASWFYAQWLEEIKHTKRFMDYIVNSRSKVVMKTIEKPPQDFLSGEDLFLKTLDHEKKVTELIHKLMELAKSENDEKTCDFLQWFVKEQVEEVETPKGILDMIHSKTKNKDGLFEIDNELAKRK